MSWRISAASLAAFSLLSFGAAAPGAQAVTQAGTPTAQDLAPAADPAGTVPLGTTTVPSRLKVIAGTDAGILYSTDSAIGGDAKYWLKATDGVPVPLAFTELSEYAKMAGRTVFVDNVLTAATISYANWNGPKRTCPYPANRYDLRYVPGGVLFIANNTVKKLVMADTGCTTVSVFTPAAGTTAHQIAGGDEQGFVLDTLTAGKYTLSYYRYDDLAHPVTLRRPAGFIPRYTQGSTPNVQAGALLASNGLDEVRIPLDGGPVTTLPDGQWSAMTKTVVASTYPGLGLRTVPVAGGAVQTKAGVADGVASDGTYIYSLNGPGEAPGIYRRTSATSAATLVVPLPTQKYPTAQWGIDVQAGRISYTNGRRTPEASYDPWDVKTRTTSIAGGKLAVGAEQNVQTGVGFAALSGSAGWLAFGGNRVRDHAGKVGQLGIGSPEYGELEPPYLFSGNRSLISDRIYLSPSSSAARRIVDLRTRKDIAAPSGGPTDLFGNYVAYSKADGTVRVRDLVRNVEGLHRPAGSMIGAVALHGKWIAWVTRCPSETPCAQTLTIRDTAAKTQLNYATRGTKMLKLSGGYLAFDAVPASARELRTIKLGTTAQTVIGSLPADPTEGYSWMVDGELANHFDLDDETLAWTDKDHLGKAVQLGAFIDAPVYLGNVIAPASMSTSWPMKLPVSKALPTCQVTIYYGSTKVRILNCANTDGMAKVTWDGKSGSGGKLVKGKYTYRVTGQDADKYNLRNYNGTLTVVGGSITKTA
ncbi:hypothetical protein [Kribbella deserti]|uniref:FlgD Ig-like domain-containing protein n=1 Tax=Kribbella deserti TaxID=1926257 RepID=A0ABV6QJS6_9ACTN